MLAQLCKLCGTNVSKSICLLKLNILHLIFCALRKEPDAFDRGSITALFVNIERYLMLVGAGGTS